MTDQEAIKAALDLNNWCQNQRACNECPMHVKDDDTCAIGRTARILTCFGKWDEVVLWNPQHLKNEEKA